MIHLKSADEIEAIGQAGEILGRLFHELREHVAPGVSTGELDRVAETFIRDHDGAEPAFKGLYGFPASICASVNEEVVHGIPSPARTLREGDTISIDAGVRLHGWYADAARTFPVGTVDAETRHLLDVTREALQRGIARARAGNRVGDIGHAVQSTAEEAGYSVVRELVGHGVGREPHEEPQIPNFGRRGHGIGLEVGLVLAIEPMINAGVEAVRTLADRWTVVTADAERSAHFEHTVAITADGPRILTAGP